MRQPPEHELHTFLVQDLEKMASEYKRIRARSTEDPGTAGDEGELAWAAVLRDWLPESYKVQVKGRVLAKDGRAGPQVDIVVLRPGYPRRLIDKKLYLAGGVAAVFECKNTLTSAHIEKTWHNVRSLNALVREDKGVDTPRTALTPDIYYGLLAHGHSWDRPGSDPRGLINGKLQDLLDATPFMRDALSLVCIANLDTWAALRRRGPLLYWSKLQIEPKELLDTTISQPNCTFSHTLASRNTQAYEPSNPLGVLVAKLVQRLARSDPALLPLSQYFHAAGVAGKCNMPVVARRYSEASQFSDELQRQLAESRYNRGDPEWSTLFYF